MLIMYIYIYIELDHLIILVTKMKDQQTNRNTDRQKATSRCQSFNSFENITKIKKKKEMLVLLQRLGYYSARMMKSFQTSYRRHMNIMRLWNLGETERTLVIQIDMSNSSTLLAKRLCLLVLFTKTTIYMTQMNLYIYCLFYSFTESIYFYLRYFYDILLHVV